LTYTAISNYNLDILHTDHQPCLVVAIRLPMSMKRGNESFMTMEDVVMLRNMTNSMLTFQEDNSYLTISEKAMEEQMLVP